MRDAVWHLVKNMCTVRARKRAEINYVVNQLKQLALENDPTSGIVQNPLDISTPEVSLITTTRNLSA